MPQLNLRDILDDVGDAELLVMLGKHREWQVELCNELGRRGVREAIPHLIERLGWDDPLVREAAAEALGHIGPDAIEAGPRLARLVVDAGEPRAVRDTAAYALGSVRYRAAVPMLVDALAASEPTVRRCAVAALVAMDDSSAAGSLRLRANVEKDSAVRRDMLRAAEMLGGREAYLALTQLAGAAMGAFVADKSVQNFLLAASVAGAAAAARAALQKTEPNNMKEIGHSPRIRMPRGPTRPDPNPAPAAPAGGSLFWRAVTQ